MFWKEAKFNNDQEKQTVHEIHKKTIDFIKKSLLFWKRGNENDQNIIFWGKKWQIAGGWAS